jgi:NAD+ diphosphatase
MSLGAITNTFAGGGLDRAGDHRRDAAWIAERWAEPGARALTVRGSELLAIEGRLVLTPAEELDGPGLFLGLDGFGPVFARETEGEPGAEGAFESLRGLTATLPPAEAHLAATARALFGWHARHRFCANCGGRTDLADAGWKRLCPACRAEHFPRTDPVVIMLATFEDRCLLGRNAAWPEGRYSALAGFLEPGESIEDACARELLEESGLRAVKVSYHSSQPWPLNPIGGQLMIGLYAEVEHDRARPDGTELAELRWLTRPEARRVLAGEHAAITAPPPMAIAHQLLNGWAGG